MQGKITKLPTNQKSGEIESDDGERFQFGFSDIDPSYKGPVNLSDGVEFDLHVDREAGLIKASKVQILSIPAQLISNNEQDKHDSAKNFEQKKSGKYWIKGNIISMPTQNEKGRIENENGDTVFFSRSNFFLGTKPIKEQSMVQMVSGMGFKAGVEIEYNYFDKEGGDIFIRKPKISDTSERHVHNTYSSNEKAPPIREKRFQSPALWSPTEVGVSFAFSILTIPSLIFIYIGLFVLLSMRSEDTFTQIEIIRMINSDLFFVYLLSASLVFSGALGISISIIGGLLAQIYVLLRRNLHEKGR